MGKTNKANRTKGNTRPSSSGHSAQLLSVDGRPLTGFIGFDGLDKEMPSYVPVTGQHGADGPDNTVDSDFRMVMRKMLKRDAITRLKAMQEFGDHCIEKDTDIVKNVLPFWPRLFNKLALDSDRRIREATHQANGKLLSKVKREVAPYLKNIMGVWLLGQCDLYAPAASTAQSVFSSTFPTNKQSEAILFCKNEIFLYFKDNLFEQTVKTMSEPSVSTAEDMENKYTLVISATLQAMKLLLTMIPKDELDNIHEYLSSIIADNKFWKFAKSKESSIRGAWYSLVSTMCQMKPDFFTDAEKKLAVTVFSCLSEGDPIVAPAIWECALSVVVHFQNCWQGIDIHKVALPQLWTLLKEGGRGNAHVLFPCLLPFLSKLPKEVIETEEFHLQFFSCLKQSLALQSVKLSAIECDAILTAFFESLQFICCVLLGSEAGSQLLEKILINEIIPLIESSLFDESSSDLAACKLYILTGAFINKLENLSCSSNEETAKSFMRVLNIFWRDVLPITRKIFSIKDPRKSISLIYLSFFYNSILQPTDCSVKPQRRSVRFVEEDKDDTVVAEESPPPDKSLNHCPAAAVLDKNALSFNYVLNFCEILCEEIDRNCHIGYLHFMEELLGSANSADLVIGLLEKLSAKNNFSSTSALEFVEKVILIWLDKIGNDEDCLICAFNIVFIFCSFVSEEEAKNILNCCSKLQLLHVEILIKIGFATYREAKFFQNWMENSSLSSTLVENLKTFVEQNKFFGDNSAILEIQIYQRLLQTCLQDIKADILIPEENFENIIDLFTDLTKQIFSKEMKDKTINLALYFIHDLFITAVKNPQICWRCYTIEDLVFELFLGNLYHVPFMKNSETTSKVIFEILDASVNFYTKVANDILDAEDMICRILEELKTSCKNLKTLEQALSTQRHILFMMDCFNKYLAANKPDLTSTEILYYSERLLNLTLTRPETSNIYINMLPMYLKKKIFYIDNKKKGIFYENEDVITYYLAWNVISSIFGSDVMVFNKEENYIKLQANFVKENLPEMLYCLTFHDSIKTVQVSELDSLIEKLKENCLKLLSLLSARDLKDVMEKIYKKAWNQGTMALCLETLHEIYPSCNLQSFASEKIDSVFRLRDYDYEKAEGKDVICQIFLHHLPFERKKFYLKELLDELKTKMVVPELNRSGYFAINSNPEPPLQVSYKLCSKMGELCCFLQDQNLVQYVDVQDFLKTFFEALIRGNFGIHKQAFHTISEAVDEHRSSNENFVRQDVEEYGSYSEDSEASHSSSQYSDASHSFREDSNSSYSLFYYLKKKLHFQMIHILSCEVQYGLCSLSPFIWDFFMSLLSSTLEKCRIMDFSMTLPMDCMQLYKAASIYKSTTELLGKVHVNQCDTEPDWKPTPISNETHNDMIHLFIHVARVLSNFKPVPEFSELIFSKFLEAMTCVPQDNLINLLKCPETDRIDVENENSVLNKLVLALTSQVRQIQFAAHTLLMKLMPTFPSMLTEEELKSQSGGEDDSEEEVVKIPYMMSPLIQQLKLMNDIVESMLLDVKIGDLCTIVPHTDSYTFSMAYLLAWMQMLEFISASPSQIRLGYATDLEEMNLLSSLFSNVFRFMPENPILCLKKGLRLESPKKEDLKLLFIKPPHLNSVSSPSEEIQSIACYVFSTALRTVPASVRTWWNNLDRKSAEIVNNFTSKYVSGLLCTAEIQAVHENEKQFENLMVQARPGSREVIATYTIDDCAIELCVQLPVNYPLGPISAERRGKVVIGQLEWRHWLMQLTTVLTYQNGSILDGLTIWKRNLDKKFEGVEECMICYYVLHSSTLKMPKLSCHVCRKKFHSACLYKWFHTSNNSTCPLCRNEFSM